MNGFFEQVCIPQSEWSLAHTFLFKSDHFSLPRLMAGCFLRSSSFSKGLEFDSVTITLCECSDLDGDHFTRCIKSNEGVIPYALTQREVASLTVGGSAHFGAR